MMRAVFQDFRCAVRSLLKTRVFTWMIIAILGLGIASNILVFTIVNAVLLHPLPYAQPEDLVILHWWDKAGSSGDVSARAFFMAKDGATTFKSIAAVYTLGMGVNLAGVRSPEFVRALKVSQGFFETLSLKPMLGRDFTPQDDLGNSPGVAILSYNTWQHHFSGDSTAIGRQIRLNGENFTIVGVMPRKAVSYPSADLWIPLRLNPANADLGSDYRVIARLNHDASLDRARSQLETLSDQSSLTYLAGSERGKVTVQRFQDFLFGDIRKSLILLSVAVFLVLMITCTNVAMLFLVRASARSQEIAIRMALGSSWGNLAKMFLTEGMILGVVGGILGIILAKESIPLVLNLLPGDLPMNTSIKIDFRVVGFTAAISLLTSIVFGIAPALKVSGIRLVETLQLASRTGTASPRQARTGHFLISAQTALTLTLLSGASLLLQDFIDLHRVPAGFDSQQMFVAQISLASKSYKETAKAVNLLERTREELRKSPNVKGIAMVSGLPMEQGMNLPLYSEDSPNDIQHTVEYRSVSSDYLPVMRVPLIAGRNFSTSDGPNTAPVAIVNETLAHLWWPNQSPIGHFVSVAREAGLKASDMRQIVGVAADIHESGLAKPVPPTVLVPFEQTPDQVNDLANEWFLTSIIVRSSGKGNVTEDIRHALSVAAPDLPLASVRPMPLVISATLARQRFYAFLVSFFGGLALLLTAVGFYGLLSYQIGLRTREIAVRIAVGATRARVVQLITLQAGRMVASGILMGLIGAYLIGRLIERFLPMVSDMSSSLLAAVLLLISVTAIVSFSITMRASSIQPMKILRQN
jgi:putative ABC transport system permease protein